ncbi:hypothetical protein [Anaeromicropila populeti]|uniref:Uncharacterized protein n=1 Tax=Anaeromicropila populeti TaxID=37658 RepID=A0A1I6LTU6_9FIRM|nr:hypothetical protein [Anaeromicropila populeti]SFS06907.1 hypothetical protein SAMN05661086_03562 [Anaeromicropila populeti]
MADRLRYKISFVVQVMDGFRNMPVQGKQVSVFIEGEKPPIQKEGGYFVFVNLSTSQFNVQIEGDAFLKKVEQVNLEEAAEKYGFLKVYMIPDNRYPIPAGTTCIEGKAAKGSKITLLFWKGLRPFQLLEDYIKDSAQTDKLRMFAPENSELDGRQFYIENKGEKTGEFFYVARSEELRTNEYRLESPLNNNYDRIGTNIYVVYTTYVNEKESFFFPVMVTGEASCDVICETIDGTRISKWIPLQTGVVNQIKFEEEER